MLDDSVQRPPLGWWIAILGGLALNAWIGFSDNAYAAWCSTVTTALPQTLIRNIFVGAVLVHIGEAAYAWRLATQANLRSATGWTLQTFLLGFPSLMCLRQRLTMRLS